MFLVKKTEREEQEGKTVGKRKSSRRNKRKKLKINKKSDMRKSVWGEECEIRFIS